ncbi:ACS family glucarate transporter-like MFS transporter [Paraburkholderia sp. BL27I4N3]|uniref:MFS transporter n=1 Tax=Paraburkholderia sp. BL27I4N3 TaxID=1938805 RepID=UPI000E2598E9|nr:MFS transporter [Paraburkholderia sp. BL27I4N3]REE07336.1 ACS family glucarate transporter-like MFS transporter [Paraburkholderia sp. BL27I4N3]
MHVEQAAIGVTKRSKVRYFTLGMIFFATAINLGDRASLSITGSAIASDLGIGPVQLGYVFSAFAWSYVIGQLPGGWLLDRFGSLRVYGTSLFVWSLVTFLQGFISFAGPAYGIVSLTLLRFLLGLVEAPVYPANSRIVSAWFPVHERGLASSIYNSSQYLAVILFTPLMGTLTHLAGWQYVFWFMGALGMITSVIWFCVMREPRDHPWINREEIDFIEHGGALTSIDDSRSKKGSGGLHHIGKLLANRMLVGIYLGQYCIAALQYFFISWFPIYLVKGRGVNIMEVGFIAVLPGLCGLAGGILGGLTSDTLVRRGFSLTTARKTPFIFGMLLGTTLVLCNFTTSIVAIALLMSIAIFGKGFGAIGWALVADTAPKEISGIAGAIFNIFGNLAGIVTPIVIGYTLQETHSFTVAMYFVAAHAVLGALSYLLIVGPIKPIKI